MWCWRDDAREGEASTRLRPPCAYDRLSLGEIPMINGEEIERTTASFR
jgi:hypothetical protein